MAVVRRYLENEVDFLRDLLLHYFNPVLASKYYRELAGEYCDTCKAVTTNAICILYVIGVQLLVNNNSFSPLLKFYHLTFAVILNFVPYPRVLFVGTGVDWWTYWETCDGSILGRFQGPTSAVAL